MNNIHKNIEKYYSKKFQVHGATPKGVDWNGENSQFIRFEQISKIISRDSQFSINDIGCGYGKYSEYLQKNYNDFLYRGYDLSQEMINSAKIIYKDKAFFKVNNLDEVLESDYSVASGIFSVKMNHTESDWISYILNTLNQLNKKSFKGFSFNMLTKYSDKEYMREDLYYADPLFFFDYCKKNFAKNISLNHDYDLYEFTILVKKG